MSSQKDIPSFFPFVSTKGAAILDGGMTTSLNPEAGKHFLWGMQLLFSKIGLDELYNVHYNFLAAGADAIETLSYKLSEELITQCNQKGLLDKLRDEIISSDPIDWIQTGIDPDTNLPTMVELYQRSIGTATKARDDYIRKTNPELQPIVVACLGPYDDACKLFCGQSDPITSSRKQSIMAIEKSNGVRKLDETEIKSMHNYYRRKLTGMCWSSNVKPDMVLFETIPSVKEALIAIEELSLINDNLQKIIPCNVAFIPHPVFGPYKINKGDGLADAVDEVIRFIHCEDWRTVRLPHITGNQTEKGDGEIKNLNVMLASIGCNCFNPNMTNVIAELVKETIDETYEELQSPTKLPRPEIIVYPNSGEYFDSREGERGWKFKDDDDMKVLDGADAKVFHEHGATVIGGCCRVTSEQIGLFATEFKN
jgi:S-methylmethionine-dependent homocysteine/selenocysteine methylase